MESLIKLSGAANKVLSNTYIKAGLALFLVLYSGLARPQLPHFVMDLFDHSVFRLLILTLVVFMGNGNIQIALLIAVAFTVTMNLLTEQKIAEGFAEGFAAGSHKTGMLSIDDSESTED